MSSAVRCVRPNYGANIFPDHAGAVHAGAVHPGAVSGTDSLGADHSPYCKLPRSSRSAVLWPVCPQPVRHHQLARCDLPGSLWQLCAHNRPEHIADTVANRIADTVANRVTSDCVANPGAFCTAVNVVTHIWGAE